MESDRAERRRGEERAAIAMTKTSASLVSVLFRSMERILGTETVQLKTGELNQVSGYR